MLWPNAALFCSFAFQVKERSERTERKVSTALFLFFSCMEIGFIKGEQWGVEIWSFSCFCRASSQTSASLGPSLHYPTCSFFNLSLCYFLTPISFDYNTHNDKVSLKKPRWTGCYTTLARSSQVINTGEYQAVIHSGEWVTLGEVVALSTCPLHLSPPVLSHLYIPFLASLLFTSHLTPVTGCSDIDNAVFEDLLNFCVYGSCLSIPPLPHDRSQCAGGH